MVQKTTAVLENMEETAACDTLYWPLPLCVKYALHHHGTSARLASTGRPTGRIPEHLAAHPVRADGHQIILGHGRGGASVVGATKVLFRDAGACGGASGDVLVEKARSSPPAPPPSLPLAWRPKSALQKCTFFVQHAPITLQRSGRAGRDTPKRREIACLRRAI